MPESPTRPTRIDPQPAWTVVTDSPLKGLALAREAGAVLAWDEGDNLYLLALDGDRRAVARAPGKIAAAGISDDGSLIALAGGRGQLWLLGPRLELLDERPTVPDPLALAVDPHGRYVAVSSKGGGRTQLLTRRGKPAGEFEARQPLAHLAFVAGRPILLGASTYGTLLGMELVPAGGSGTLRAVLGWQSSLMSNIGRLAATGDGGIILASCFTHGIQRYDLRGGSEGSYHTGGAPAHAVPDFAGRSIVVATLESELAVLSQAGNVRWKSATPRPAVALDVDALGRFFVYGMATGELTRVDLDAPPRQAGAAGSGPGASRVLVPSRTPVGGSVRRPDWEVPLASTDEQAETAVLAVLDDPPRIAVLTGQNRLRVFRTDGKELGQGPEVAGVGRFLRTAPGWIVAGTDRMVALHDARHDRAARVELSLTEVTHLAIRPDGAALAIVQERDRLGVAAPDGRWAWKHELDSPVEDLAILPDGLVGATTGEGRLRIYGPDGTPLAVYTTDPPEPLAMVEAPERAPAELAFVTLARRHQVLRGHRADGRVLWEAATPWEGWQLHRVGTRLVVAAPDGRALAFAADGRSLAQSRDGEPMAAYCPGPGGKTWRVARHGVHLISADLAGNVNWRVVADAPIGPLAAGRPGVAALLGRRLAWLGTT